MSSGGGAFRRCSDTIFCGPQTRTPNSANTKKVADVFTVEANCLEVGVKEVVKRGVGEFAPAVSVSRCDFC
jgi:hypothetical protein